MSTRREVNVNRPEHSWIPFYRELARTLIEDGWRERQPELVGMLKEMGAAGLPVPKPLRELPVDHIDPFTFFAAFNSKMSSSHRAELILDLARRFELEDGLKSVVYYVPDARFDNSIFFNWNEQMDYTDRIQHHWDTFEFVSNANPFGDRFDSAKFVDLVDRSLDVRGVRISKLSSAFYWINPERFLQRETINGIFEPNTLKDTDTGDAYLRLLRSARGADPRPFFEINDEVYLRDHDPSPLPKVWMVRGGQKRHAVQEFLVQNRVGIAFDLQHVDLSTIGTKRELRKVYQEHHPHDSAQSVGQNVSQLDDFVLNVQIGDFVVMPGDEQTHHGMVISRPYLEKESPYTNSRKIRWSDASKQKLLIPSHLLPPQITVRIVSDEVQQTVLRANGIIRDDASVKNDGNGEKAEYDITAMIKEDVFLNTQKIKSMLRLLRMKKNLILQGPPGVGKTFIGRKLAYLLMGERTEQRITSVQFHQAYSYEDFVGGFRPAVDEDSGQMVFEPKDGPFLEVCEKAQNDPENKHVVLIDEINRGNLSRVFGELLMLIEADKRKPEFGVKLQHRTEKFDTFFVPENVYIIGTMNLADRSLTGMNVAMRRRFGFVDLEPQFGKKVFTDWLRDKTMMPSAMQDDINAKMQALNTTIAKDPSLDHNYAVGHSFFCPPPDGPSGGWKEWYADVIEYEIRPLLREYWFDAPDTANREADKLLPDVS